MVFVFSFLPFLLLSSAVEGMGIWHLGVSVTNYGRTVEAHQREDVLLFQVVQLAASLLILFLGTQLVLWICEEGFRSPATYSQAFTLTAYGITPLFWLRILDGAPAVPTWVCFAIGAAGIFYVLYHGVALVLEPDPSIGFGLYLICSLMLVLVAGLAHFVVQAVAQRKFNFVSLLFEQSVAIASGLF